MMKNVMNENQHIPSGYWYVTEKGKELIKEQK